MNTNIQQHLDPNQGETTQNQLSTNSIYLSWKQKTDDRQINPTNISLAECITHIKQGTYKSQIDYIRNQIKSGIPQEEKQDLKKDNLGLWFLSCILTPGKGVAANNVQSLNGVMGMDVDHVPPEKYEEIKEHIIKRIEPIYLFKSVSGGIKYGVMTDLKPEDYKVNNLYETAYKTLIDAHDNVLKEVADGVNTDDRCSNINRGCYFAYDDDAYISDNYSITYVRDATFAFLEDAKVEEEENRKRFLELQNQKAQQNQSEDQKARQSKIDEAVEKYLEQVKSSYLNTPSGCGGRYKAFFKVGQAGKEVCLLNDGEVRGLLLSVDYDGSRAKKGQIDSVIKSLNNKYYGGSPLKVFDRNYTGHNPQTIAKRLSLSTPQNEIRLQINQYITEVEDEIRKTIDAHKRVLLLSATNTGKTWWMLDQVRVEKTLIVTPLVSITQQLEATLKSRQLDKSYACLYGEKHMDKTLGLKGGIVGVYDKIADLIDQHLLGQIDISKYVFHLDECHNLYKSGDYRNGVMEKIYSNLNIFKKVVFYSGTFDNRMIDLQIDKTIKVDNHKPQKTLNLNYCRNKTQAEFVNYVQGVENEIKHLIFCNDKKECKVLAEKIGKPYLILSRDTKSEDDIKEMLSNEMLGDDISILFTTSVGVEGINLKNTNIGHIHYYKGFAGTVSTTDMEQLSNRARKVNACLHLWVDEKKNLIEEQKDIISIDELSLTLNKAVESQIECVNGFEWIKKDEDNLDLFDAIKSHMNCVNTFMKDYRGRSIKANHEGRIEKNETGFASYLYATEVWNETRNIEYAIEKMKRLYNYKVVKTTFDNVDDAFVKSLEGDLRKLRELTKKEIKEIHDDYLKEIHDAQYDDDDLEKEYKKYRDGAHGQEGEIKKKIAYKYLNLSRKRIVRDNIRKIIEMDKEFYKVLDILDAEKHPKSWMWVEKVRSKLKVGDELDEAKRAKILIDVEAECRKEGLKHYDLKDTFDDDGNRTVDARVSIKLITTCINGHIIETKEDKLDENGQQLYYMKKDGSRGKKKQKRIRKLKVSSLDPKWFKFIQSIDIDTLENEVVEEPATEPMLSTPKKADVDNGIVYDFDPQEAIENKWMIYEDEEGRNYICFDVGEKREMIYDDEAYNEELKQQEDEELEHLLSMIAKSEAELEID